MLPFLILLPRKPTCPLKNSGWNMKFLLKWPLFRKYVSLSLSYGPDLGDTRSGGRMGRFKKSKKIKKNKKNKKHQKKTKKTKRTKKHMHHCFSLAWAIILWSAFDKVLGGAGRAIKAILFDTLT